MTIYRWPSELAPRGVAFNQRGMTVSGPPALSGRTQVASLDAGYWVASFRSVPVGGPASVRAFRALRAKLEGGAHQIDVPVFDSEQAPWPAAGGRAANAKAELPWSGGGSFFWSDGHGWFNPAILVSAAAAVAAGATALTLTPATAGALAGGMYFSHFDRLYVLRELLATAGSDQTWSIWPRVRDPIAAGADLNFETPVCRMRLLSESEMDLGLEFGRYGFPDMAFIEVF